MFKITFLKKNRYPLLIVFISLIIISYNLYNIYIDSKIVTTDTTHITFSTTFKNELIIDSAEVNSTDIPEFTIDFKSYKSEVDTYNLSVYWDFQKIDFTVDKNKYDEYPINLINSDFFEKKINFKINKKFENNLHKLTIVINKSNSDNERFNNFTSTYTFVLNDNFKNTTFADENSSFKLPFKTYSNKVSYLNVLNADFSDDPEKYEEIGSLDKEKVLNTSPNTEIALAIRFNNFSKQGNQLLFIELNNKQIPIDNKPFLVYNLEPNVGFVYDKIKITAPNAPGTYIVKSIVATNPTNEDYTELFYPNFTYKIIVK